MEVRPHQLAPVLLLLLLMVHVVVVLVLLARGCAGGRLSAALPGGERPAAVLVPMAQVPPSPDGGKGGADATRVSL